MKSICRKAAAFLVVAAAAASAAVWADEAEIKRILQGRLPTMRVESVRPTPFAGLYEVILDGEIVYTDRKAEYFFGGNIYDIRSLPPRNLTAERADQIAAQAFTRARELAIKRVNGDGSRTLFTFEDPNCSYCKALQRELAQLKDVTVYTFLLPLLSEDSVRKSIAVWCAPDRARAWAELMGAGVMPQNAGSCAHPLDRIAALARRFQIERTPSIYLGNGRHIGGMRSAADIEKAFALRR